MTEGELGSPAEELLAHPTGERADGDWILVARSKRVNRGWEALIDRSPENALRW